MLIDLFKNKVHNLKKKNTGKDKVIQTIEPIVRFVSKDLIMRYLDNNKIDYKAIEWGKSPALLKLDLVRIIERTPQDKYKEIFNDFCRVNRMCNPEGVETLQRSIFDIPFHCENDYDLVFWCFINHGKLFEDAEYTLNYVDPYKSFLQNLVTNGKIFGVLFVCVSFLINLAQILNDESEARYVAQNIIHFILGCLTVACIKNPKGSRK